MINFHYISLLLCLLSSFAHSQIKLQGRVLDEHKNPLMGVNVFLQGTIEGSSTDENGIFSFTTHQKGKAVLLCKHLAMNDVSMPLLLEGDVLGLSITMLEKEAMLEEVVLTAGKFSIDDKRRAVVLNTMDVDTTPSAGGDIVATLAMLPGAQQVGESGLLFVRGGDGQETKITIDGLQVSHPFYSSVPDVAQRNRFSPHIFKGIIFNTGGYASQYGDALSSVLSLETNDHPSKPSTVLAFLPYGVQVGHDFLSKTETRSGGFDVGYFNFKPYQKLITPTIEWIKPPESVSVSGTFRQNTAHQGFLKWYGYGNSMRQAIYQSHLEMPGSKQSYSSKNTNAVSILTYTQDISDRWMLYTGYGLNFNNDEVSVAMDSQENWWVQQQVKAVAIGSLTERLKTEVGTEGFSYNNQLTRDYTTALWGSLSWQVANRLILQGGLRSEYNEHLARAIVLPRVSLGYRTGKYHQVFLSAGEYSQRPEEKYLSEYRHLDFGRATHYISNFQYTQNGRVFRIEGYYKRYKNLLSYEHPTAPTSTGKGYATGIDIFWRDAKSIKGLDYWLSYSYLDTQRRYLHYPTEVQPSFATPHTGHIVVKYFIESLGLFVGGGYSVSSGRAYENPNNPIFLSDRTTATQNVSLNVALLRKGKKVFNTIVFSVNNLTGERPIFGYRYSRDGSYREAISLPYKRSYMVGWFISIGKDRSDEILSQLP